MKFLSAIVVLTFISSTAFAGCPKPIKCEWISKAPGHEQNVGEICLQVHESNELGTIYTHTLNAGEFTISVVKRKSQPGSIELVLMSDAGAEITGSDIPATGNDQFQVAFGGDLMVSKRTIVKKHTKKFQFTYKNGMFENIYNCRL